MGENVNQAEQEKLLKDVLVRITALEEALVQTGKLTTDDLRTFRVVAEPMVDQDILRMRRSPNTSDNS